MFNIFSIPSVSTEDYKGKKVLQLRKELYQYYKDNYQGKVYLNEDRCIQIHCKRVGGEKFAFGGNLYPEKACLIEVLPYLLRHGVYNNFGNRKTTDKPDIIGYLNFKAKVIIDGREKFVRLAIMLKKDGLFYYNFYYNHEVNIYPTNKKA